MRTRIRQALRAAMKSRDAVAVSALRSVLAAIDNAEAVPLPEGRLPQGGVIAGAVDGLGAGEAPRVELSEDQAAEIVRAEWRDARAAAEEYRQSGQDAHAARMLVHAEVLASLLGGGE